MSVGHVVGTFSEPISQGLCLLAISNEVLCSAFKLGVHELIIEPIVDSSIHATASSAIRGEWLTFNDLDPYNFCAKLIGSLAVSKAAEKYYGESILVSSITGVAGSYLADYLYNANFSGSLERCKLDDQCFDELALMTMTRSVTGSWLADLAYQSFATSNHTHSEI